MPRWRTLLALQRRHLKSSTPNWDLRAAACVKIGLAKPRNWWQGQHLALRLIKRKPPRPKLNRYTPTHLRNPGPLSVEEILRWWHLFESRQGRIDEVPSVTPRSISQGLRFESAWFVKACGVHGE